MKTLLLFLSCSLLATTVFAQGVTFTATSMNTPGTQRAIVDMDSDGLDDIVSVSQTNINIHYQLLAGGFNSVDITTTPADYLPSWSLAAADYDGNGYTDLLYGSGSGVTFMRASDDGTAFTEISGPEYVFSQRSNFVDINNDGHLDAFVCHDVEPNVYYLNDGTGNLTFHQGGLGDYPSGGNYGSVWVDYNNDGNIDLFIAKCGGSAARRQNELFMGNGDGTFTDMSTHSNLADSMQTWSSAWGDYDNDGDLDAFVGASSFSDGFHRLMRNNGDGSFTDVINASGLTGFSSTGIENTPADVNNDGFLDIISNGHVLYGAGDLTFPTVNLNVLSSDTGSLGDLNNDGFIDAYSGETMYMNNGNANNWIALYTRGDDSNMEGIGARVQIETPSGTQIRDVRSGEGFRFMSTLRTNFGIGTDTQVDKLTIFWPSGVIDKIINPAINTVHTVTEGTFLAVDENTAGSKVFIHPNPVGNLLTIKGLAQDASAQASVFSVTGQQLVQPTVVNKAIDVSQLAAGTYFVAIVSNGKTITKKMIKQ